MSDEARLVWDRTVNELPAGADPAVFAMYCGAIADHHQAQRLLNQAGPLMRDPKDNLVPSPLNRVKENNAALARRLAKDLGIGIDHDIPPIKRTGWRNRRATERTVEGLRKGGRLELADEASIALARTMAEALDTVDAEQYPAQLASLARVHLSTLRLLRGKPDNDDDAGVADWLAALSSPMGDAPEA
jgi:hypothetical protein